MIKYKVYTLGCKVAQAEGYQLKLLLEQFDCLEALPGEVPELCLVNTCAVTSTASSKSRRLIRKLTRLYPNAKIILLGCYATLADDSILSSIPQIVLCADHRQGIFSAVEKYLSHYIIGKGFSPEPDNRHDVYDNNLFSTNNIKHGFGKKVKNKFLFSRHRAFLKIQDGCDARCSYCIIPYLRPKISSLEPNDVIEQAKKFIASGHKEIVLCGIFLGAYGKNTAKRSRFRDGKRQPIIEIIERLLDLTGLERLRLSSLEPLDLTDELLSALASSDKTARHLHLPLQSGSDTILQKMARQYRINDYLKSVERARKYLPDVALTTDVIVGFPYETEEDFQQTLKICKLVGFSKIHIFPFSPRKGTAAYKWKDRMVAPDVMKRRMDELRQLENQLRNQYYEKFADKTVRVLVEQIEHINSYWRCTGRADQYFKVQFTAKESLDNQMCLVKIINTDAEPLTGRIEHTIRRQGISKCQLTNY